MSFKTELAGLNPRDRKQELATVVVGVLIIALAWLFGTAKYFILVVAPVASLLSHASNRGIGIRKTPQLYTLLILACSSYFVAIAYVLDYIDAGI